VNREAFRAMGCDVVVGGATAAETERIRELFERRNRIFSRFVPGSELNRVNGAAGHVVVVSQEFGRMVQTALDAALRTDGLVDPTLGEAVEAAGYDRDFAELLPDERPPGDARPGRGADVRVAGRIVDRPTGVLLDLNGVVKSQTVDDALRLLSGPGFVSAGGDLATTTPIDVSLPGGDLVRVEAGGLATTSRARRRWLRGGEWQHHLIDPGTGRPSQVAWTDATVAAGSCLDADVAAKAAFLLGEVGAYWLDERGLAGRFVLPWGGTVLSAAWPAGAEREVAARCA
jgi:thiamine biosynthesis lipoprotein